MAIAAICGAAFCLAGQPSSSPTVTGEGSRSPSKAGYSSTRTSTRTQSATRRLVSTAATIKNVRVLNCKVCSSTAAATSSRLTEISTNAGPHAGLRMNFAIKG